MLAVLLQHDLQIGSNGGAGRAGENTNQLLIVQEPRDRRGLSEPAQPRLPSVPVWRGRSGGRSRGRGGGQHRGLRHRHTQQGCHPLSRGTEVSSSAPLQLALANTGWLMSYRYSSRLHYVLHKQRWQERSRTGKVDIDT